MARVLFYVPLSYRVVKNGRQGLHDIVGLVRRIRAGILYLVEMLLVHILQWKGAELLTEPSVWT